MLDIKRIREDYEGIKAAVESRGQGSYGIEKVLDIDSRRRQHEESNQRGNCYYRSKRR